MSTKLSKYAEKIRAIAKESSLDENTPDKYLLAIADAVENNKFQLSAVIESHINTRKELNSFRKAFTGDILTLENKINALAEEYSTHKQVVEKNINATTLFHQNMTDLLIAYFGIPKKTETETSENIDEDIPSSDIPSSDETGLEEELEVPEIVSEEEDNEEEEPEDKAVITPEEIITERKKQEAPDGVREFKPKGKKK